MWPVSFRLFTVRLMSREEQESHDTCSFDGIGRLSLLTSAQAGVAARFDLAVVACHHAEERQVFVVNVLGIFEGFAGGFHGAGS